MVTFQHFQTVAPYRQCIMNAYLIHYISLAISQKEWSVLDKAIEAYF